MSLPSGYTKLGYIQSDGSQYIDTGFIPNQDTQVVCDVLYTTLSEKSSHYLFGARQSNGVLTYGVNAYGGVYQSMYNSQTTDMGSSINTRFTIDKNKNVITINGTEYTQTYAAFTCPVTMYLFAINNNGVSYGFSSATLFSCKIYDNGTLVRDFIPAKNTGGVAGLWDDVNSAFYADAAGGNFIDPSVPVGNHNTIIGGVVYEIEGGRVLLGGVEYELEKGLVMVDGVVREIVFASKQPVVVTISGTLSSYRYATINGTRITRTGTYEYTEMPTISVYLNAVESSGKEYTTVSLNGTRVQKGTGTYTLHTEDRNITIEFGSTYLGSEDKTYTFAKITTS